MGKVNIGRLVLSRILAQFLFAFVSGYNSYAAQLLYVYDDKSLWNLQLALSELIGQLNEGNGYNT